MRVIICSVVTAMAMAGSASASVITEKFSSFWALGDSLSDDGNLPSLAFRYGSGFAPLTAEEGNSAYYATGAAGAGGRFSNGQTFAEHIAAEFGSAGRANDNFAVGGSEAAEPIDPFDSTPGLDWQQDRLSRERERFGDRPLVSMLSGANDIFAGLDSDDPMAGGLAAAIRAADAISAAANKMAALNISDFLIGNLPDLGLTPAYALLRPQVVEAASAATRAFNDRLASNVAKLRSSGLNVIDLDLYGTMNDIFADPTEFGFTDVTMPCMFPGDMIAEYFGQARYCSDEESQTRLFFDMVHPNYLAHEQIAELALGALEENLTPAPVPLGGTMPMMIGGVFALAALRRRSRAVLRAA